MALCLFTLQPALAQAGRAPVAVLAPAGVGAINDNPCDSLARSNWPPTVVARRQLLFSLQAFRQICIDHAPFLGLLGGLLLEEGDPSQALIWIERSLLLEPDNPGTQASLALVLAELGQPLALQELRQAWRGRADLPPALRSRLFPSQQPPLYALPNVRLGQPERSRWGATADASVVTGHEDNLDRSPRLSELTLTVPEGPLVLPVSSQPRRGAATLLSGSFQTAYAPSPSTVLRTGLSASARSAPSQHETDWQQLQWVFNASQSWNGVRAQIEVSSAWFTGKLGEPYRLQRLSVGADAALGPCRLRLSADNEGRTQSRTDSLDASANGAGLSLSCSLDEAQDWTATVIAREGRDKPRSADRPGGAQRLTSYGLRLTGTLGWGTRLEATVRRGASGDSTGYSPLLQDNAVRQLNLTQTSIDLAYPLPWGNAAYRLELLLQWQSAHQRSNLPLFDYRAQSVYGGLRWAW